MSLTCVGELGTFPVSCCGHGHPLTLTEAGHLMLKNFVRYASLCVLLACGPGGFPLGCCGPRRQTLDSGLPPPYRTVCCDNEAVHLAWKALGADQCPCPETSLVARVQNESWIVTGPSADGGHTAPMVIINGATGAVVFANRATPLPAASQAP